MLKASEVAARALGIQLHFVEARGPADIDKAFAEIVGARADAVTVLVSGMLLGNEERIVKNTSGRVKRKNVPEMPGLPNDF